MSFLPTDFGGWLGAANSAASLISSFTGGGERSARDQMADQMYFGLLNSRLQPKNQVIGMRAAGLNPMLVATKGMAPTTQPTSGVQDDRAIDIQKNSARAVMANQLAQANLYNAQAENVKAQTGSEVERPANIRADTSAKGAATTLAYSQSQAAEAAAALSRASELQQNQLTKTEGWNTKLKELEYSLQGEMYPQKLKQLSLTVASMVEDLKLAERLGKLNESQFGEIMGYIERFTGALGLSAGSLSNLRRR